MKSLHTPRPGAVQTPWAVAGGQGSLAAFPLLCWVLWKDMDVAPQSIGLGLLAECIFLLHLQLPWNHSLFQPWGCSSPFAPCCQALLPAGHELALSVEFVVLAAPKDLLAAEEGQECTNKADIFPWHIPGPRVVPRAGKAVLALPLQALPQPRAQQQPQPGWLGRTGVYFPSPEIPPYPREERNPRLESFLSRLSVPGLGSNTSSTKS